LGQAERKIEVSKSIIILAVPHQLQGPNFNGYIDDPSYSLLVKDKIHGVDFVFEEVSGRGPSTAENLANSKLGPDHYLNIDPTPGERSQCGIKAVAAGGYPIDPWQSVGPGVPHDVVECGDVEQCEKRERIWLERVQDKTFSKGLVICGLAHGLSFAFRLVAAGISVEKTDNYIPYHKLCSRPHA
jgi:hypothetical protein